MTKILVLLIFIAVTVNAQHLPARNADNVNFALSTMSNFVFETDKKNHIGGSYLISSTISAIVYNKTKNEKLSLISGLGFSLLVGAGKEMYDIKNGDYNWGDMLANAIGAAMGVVIIKIAI